MFRSPQQYRTFLTLLLTFFLDLAGYSIVFPVLPPLLLNSKLQFFASGTTEEVRLVVLGLLFALFGITNFIGGPVAGALADHYGRKKVFLATIGLSILGYAVMAFSIYIESLAWMFVGRGVTGFCSGNSGLAQSATADLTDAKHRVKAMGILQGMAGLGFIVGPWLGGKLANPDWLHGSGAFIFAAIAALCNFLMMAFFFIETWKRTPDHERTSLLTSFKDTRIVLQQKTLRDLLVAFFFFAMGWSLLLYFSPTFLVQKFSLGSNMIGDIFAYMAIIWFFTSTFLNKELAGKFSAPFLIMLGLSSTSIGMILYLWPSQLWPYWMILPLLLFGGAVSWVNLSSMLSTEASENMQGRAMGALQSLWALAQIISSLIAGVLAGWNLYLPLAFGAFVIAVSFVYFFQRRKSFGTTFAK